MTTRIVPLLVYLLTFLTIPPAFAQDSVVSNRTAPEQTQPEQKRVDRMRDAQSAAIQDQKASWGRWGHLPDQYSSWRSHSNRLIPIYTYGMTLDQLRKEGSVYADAERLEKLYGIVPEGTLNPEATYFDETDVYRLQAAAAEAGKKNIIVLIFDGMDWQTARAAAIYSSGKVGYDSGRGTGLAFQDYGTREGDENVLDFGLFCCSPRLSGAKFDVNTQTVLSAAKKATGGYDVARGGAYPWEENSDSNYLLGKDPERPHTVTDSAAAATSLFSGIKTYNGAANVTVEGVQVVPIARKLQQEKDFRIGVVSNVPVSHATPGITYANNVSRSDYQDIGRDLVGLPSIAHPQDALPGVDVLIGAGWGEGSGKENSQGDNFAPGNRYLHEKDLHTIDVENGGKYVVAQRQKGQSGRESIMRGARQAANGGNRFLGFYGTKGGHLPYQTADGNYDPTFGVNGAESYSEATVHENPTLADMAEAALTVLETSPNGFYLMIEAGDVDFANHANNIDDSIGAVLSGDEAFTQVVEWVDRNQAWDETAVIVTADHGHFFVIKDAQEIASFATP